MARSLGELQKRYSSTIAPEGPGGPGPRGPGGRGPGGPGGRGRRATGKPKNTKATILRLIGYLKNQKLKLLLVAICMIFSTLSSLFGSYMLAPIINKLSATVVPDIEMKYSAIERIADSIITKFTDMIYPAFSTIVPSEQFALTMTYVIAALIILACIYIIGVAATYLQSRVMLSISQGAIESIRNDLFKKVQTLPVRFHDNHPTGEIMSRFTNDVDNIGVMFDNSLVSIVSGTVTLVGTFLFMITTNLILTLVTVVFIPIFIKLGGAIAKRSSKYYSGQQSALGAVNGYIEESVTGQKVVKVFNHENECIEEFETLNDDLRDKQFKAQFFGGIMGPITGNTSQISYGITIGVGGIMMCTSGFTPGALTIFAQYSRQFSRPINEISQQTSTIFSALAGAERVFKIMDLEPEEPDVSEPYEPEEIKGDVILENVTFGYNPDKTILKNISLWAKAGQKIAFVGSTGAGKTTITNLLNRFYDIKDGIITIDGVDIKKYSRDTLRKNIAMVLQDTHLFTGTVMENIRYGRLDATDEEVIAAAKVASAHSFIMRLSDGYNTLLEGDGANLSQGQRQLINIARAALSKAPILVLDEATSSVDTRTERHIEHGMDRLMKNRTTFVIAHRLSTVRNSNAIMVLEDGEIIERGDHDDLLNQKGRYYELYTGLKELD